MAKREASLIFVFLLIIFASVFAAATSDIAYLYRRQIQVDENILNVFDELNLTYDLINEKNQPSNYNTYKLLFVGDENYKKNIPVNNYPTIISSYYNAEKWGLTDNEGISQLGGTHPLSVLVNGYKFQVYTIAYDQKRVSIPYYYLGKDNKADALERIAATETTSSGYKIGDVISYAEEGKRLANGKTQQGKLCFYGIVESEYWTPKARELFKDCVAYVAAECVLDSDCPPAGNSTHFCVGDDVYLTQFYYTCEDGVFGECVLHEEDVLVEECFYQCLNGACIGECETDADCDDSNETTIDICNFPGTPQSYCTNEEVACFDNTDCGIDGFVGELFCSEKNVVQLFESYVCNNPGQLNASCSLTSEERIIEICDKACLNAECVDINCTSDSDCDDLNPLTLDQCINANTTISECRNTPFNCGSDDDCGFTGFFGSEFCLGNEVVKSYQTAICVNPGMLNSVCSVNQTQETVQVCANACLNGSCITCDENSDCDDSNVDTEDICQNPGTLGSYCENIPDLVRCSDDSDCGSITILTQQYCSINDVNQLIRTWNCENAGTAQSYCSSNIEQQTVETCSNYCLDATCVDIECFTHAQCDDNNDSTLDICDAPGTAQANCVNNPIDVICSSDGDCGADGFIGGEFCLNSNVTKLFQTFTCHAPGTNESFCSSMVTQKTTQECNFTCSNGACFDPACFTDADCPASGLTGNPYCQGNDVYQENRIYKCENPGTLNAFCDFNSTPAFIGSCPFACIQNGICVRCDENSDCDDGNSGTQDSCLNPGTIASSCQNVQTCNDECGLAGARQCSSAGSYQICGNYDGDACLEWSGVTSCSAGQICSGGQCVSGGGNSCTDDCTAGSRQCVGNSYKVCGNFDTDSCLEWSGTTQCGFGKTCLNGFCT